MYQKLDNYIHKLLNIKSKGFISLTILVIILACIVVTSCLSLVYNESIALEKRNTLKLTAYKNSQHLALKTLNDLYSIKKNYNAQINIKKTDMRLDQEIQLYCVQNPNRLKVVECTDNNLVHIQYTTVIGKYFSSCNAYYDCFGSQDCVLIKGLNIELTEY